MLPCQHRCGYQYRHLPASHGHQVSGPHGDLGLAETNVAADQAVHGHFALQIVDHVADGLGLALGFFERKPCLELLEVSPRFHEARPGVH